MSTLPMRNTQSVSWMLAVLLIVLVLRESYAFHALSPTRRSSFHIISSRRQSPLPGLSNETPEDPDTKKNPSLLRLAELSLKDYDWRSSVFKSKEADRKVEESLARMMGDEPIYVRPMDASEGKIGPLGIWEKTSVQWLRDVIEEEAIRARKIVQMGGMMVRPIEAKAPDGELGPLGFMEKQFVDFLDKVRQSERQRSKSKTLRPMEMEESMRGPLGEAEWKAVKAIREIVAAEKLRMNQSRLREVIVRPIDVPGPIGELEMKILDVIEAERRRALDGVRPKDASKKGPLGELEEQAVAIVEKLTIEEKERLRNINRFLSENRPMEQDKKSFWGILETVAVGIFRAPILVYQIIVRVKELVDSQILPVEDAEVLKERAKNEPRND